MYPVKKAAVIFLVKFIAAFFFALLFSGCFPEGTKKVNPSFYYWKSVFRLTEKEKKVLTGLSVATLYIKFFDVSWNRGKAEPVARIRFQEQPPAGTRIIPVVFITNETLIRIGEDHTDTLAYRIAHLVEVLSRDLPFISEVQLDCDWSAGTRDKYFRMLTALRQQRFIQGKKLSVTIRLHQLKYKATTGIPPADKGLLMCYNMGNLRRPETLNSIIDKRELEKYLGGLGGYALPLDIALPLFDWFVWFRNGEYKGLIHPYRLPGFNKENLLFPQDTTINNFRFEKGDWLRYEGSRTEEVVAVARSVSSRMRQEALNVVLYHLDEPVLEKYQLYEMEAMFDSFR